MPSTRELRRGVALGLYPDVERAQREERRLQIAEEGAQITAAREARVAANDDARTRLETLRLQNQEAKEKAAALAEARVLEDSIAATTKLAALAANTDDFPLRLQKIVAEHPRALADKAFQEQYDWNTGLHREYSTQRQAMTKLEEEQRTKREERAEVERLRKEAANELKAQGGKVTSATITEKGQISPTVKFEEPTPTLRPAEKLADLNKRLGAEFGVELADVNNPAANMRRVTPVKGKKAIEAVGDEGGSHYAFDVGTGDKAKTVMIPVDRFKSYADEYAAVNGKPAGPVPVVPVAPTGPASITSQSDYEALPSGSEFVFNGKRGKKP